MRTPLFAALALLFLCSTAVAHEYEAGNLAIHHPYAYEVLKGNDVSHAFMTIANDGEEEDTLLRVTSPIASHIDIMDNDNEKVEELDIPAHGAKKLKPNGYYLALSGIKKPIKIGVRKPVTLHFEHAGEVKAQLLFSKIGEISKCDDGSNSVKLKPKN